MKLRIKENNIRLRLTQIEVQSISQGQEVRCECQLADAIFTYVLKTSSKWNAVANQHGISITIPVKEMEGWAENDRVGFEHTFQNGLFLLIEKDFQCLHPRKDENEDDLYPNPAEN